MKRFAVVVISLLVVSMFTTLEISGIASADSENLRYTAHDPIRINSDADFDYAHGVVGGSGTWDDPYVISGWRIDASGETAAIYIGNTTKYFKIYDCYLSNAQGGSGFIPVGYGIEIYNSANGIIEYVTSVYNHNYGIYIHESDNIKVAHSTIYSNGLGSVYVYSSTGVTIGANRMNNYIQISSSDGVNVTANTLTSENIFVSSTSQAYIANNSIKDVDGDAIHLSDISYSGIYNNTIVNATNGIYITTSIRDNEIAGNEIEDANHTIYIYSSRYVIVRNNTLKENYNQSIYLSLSSHITIMENNLSSTQKNGDMIYLSQSNYNVIRNNTMWKVKRIAYYGITLYKSTQNIVEGNNLTNGDIYLNKESDGNTIRNNTLNHGGIYIASSHNTVINNTISNIGIGISLENYVYEGEGAAYNLVKNNKIINYTYGIEVYFSSNNTLDGNIIVDEEIIYGDHYNEGISIIGSNYTVVINNTISKHYRGIGIYGYMPSPFGTLIAPTYYTRIVNNTIYGNENGIVLWANSTYITGNLIHNNSAGIHIGDLYGSLYRNTICKNRMYNNTYGILLENNDEDGSIQNNTFIDNNVGIYIKYSIAGRIENNNFTSNYRGVYIENSRNITVEDNTFQENRYGIYLTDAENSTITKNLIAYSRNYGIYVVDSSGILIYNNSLYYNNGAGDSYVYGHVQAYDNSNNNSWNSTDMGNYWSDWTTPDSDGDGIVDNPYVIDGGAGAKDYYPLAEPEVPIPEISIIPVILLIIAAIIVFRKRP